MSIVDLLNFQGETPKDLVTINQWNSWMEPLVGDILWTPKQLQEYVGVGAQRLQDIRREEGIPGFVCIGEGVYLYLRKFAEPWAADYVANRKGRVGRKAGFSTAKREKSTKPKPVRLPAYIKHAQEHTPHLVLLDRSLALDSPGVTALHHHWSDFGESAKTAGRPKSVGKWRNFHFQGKPCSVPLRFNNPHDFTCKLLQDIGRSFPQFCVVDDSEWGFALTDSFTEHSKFAVAPVGLEAQFASYQQLVALRREVWNIRDRLKSIYLES